MGRSKRGEPVWPLLIILAVVVAGGLGVIATNGARHEGSVATLEAEGMAAPMAEPVLELPTPWDRVRVEVLNAGGVRGAAAEGRDLLRDRGFDVVYFGNAPTFGRDATLVLDRTGKDGAAAAVARSLGVQDVRVEPDQTLFVDVTVLLGTDWEPGVPGPELLPTDPAGVLGDSPWWAPRRLVDLFNRTR